jgi:O-antigen/teichoic acid export membrane protein
MHYTKSVSAQALARIVYVLSGSISFIVLARILGPEALGGYVYAINLVTIASSFADLGSTGILARDLVVAGAEQPVYLANFIAFRMLLGTIVGLLTLPVAIMLAPPGLAPVLVLCCVLMPFLAARFFDPVFQVAARPWLSLWHTGAYGILQLLTSICIAATASDPITWLVVAFAVTTSAYGIVGFLLAVHLMSPQLWKVTWRGVTTIAIAVGPFGISGLFSTLSTRLDVFLVASLGSTAMVGQYNAAFRFIDLGIAVVITVLMPLVTVFANLATHNRAALVTAFQAMMRFLATWCTALAVLAPTLSPLVVHVLYGAAFEPTIPVLNLLAWKFQIAFCNLLCFAVLMTVTSIRFAWWNALLALVLNLCLNALLIPSLGIVGSGIASIASELSQTVIDIWFLARAMGNIFELHWWRRLIVAALAATIVVHLPVPLAPIWMFLPALLVFIGTMHLTCGLPGNPVTEIRRAEAAHQSASVGPE